MNNTKKLIWVVGVSSTILFLSYLAYKEYKLQMSLKAINEDIEKELASYDEKVDDDVQDVLDDELEPLEEIFEEVEVLGEEYLEETSLIEQMLDWSEEELSEMRFDSSSPEAWEQYKLYLLSDIPVMNRRLRNAMDILHGHTIPYYASGEFVFSSMYEDRMEFFGNDSIYTTGDLTEVQFTFAEFLLQIARQLSIDLDQPMVNMLGQLYDNVICDSPSEDYNDIIKGLVTNSYINCGGYFGVMSLDMSIGQQWYDKSLFEQYNQYIYDKIEYGMYAIPGKGDMNV